MSDIDLEQSADVLWTTVDTELPQRIMVGEQQRFGTVREAILFAMEALPPRHKATAWIKLQDGSLQIKQIEALYRDIKNSK